jgi:hypothetical protein
VSSGGRSERNARASTPAFRSSQTPGSCFPPTTSIWLLLGERFPTRRNRDSRGRLHSPSRPHAAGERFGDDAMEPCPAERGLAARSLLATPPPRRRDLRNWRRAGLPVTSCWLPLSCWRGSRYAGLVRLRSIQSPSSWYASYVASAPQKRCRVWLKPPLVKARTFAGRTANTRAVPTSCRKPS